jgi:hypothetical protein
MPQVVLSFNFNFWPFLLLSSKKTDTNYFIFFIYFGLNSYLGFLLKYLIGLSNSYLIDMGAYETHSYKFIFNSAKLV